MLLGIIFYVAAVMATTFFRETLPEFFGSFWASLFSLFQIATLSSWETIVRPAMDEHEWAWAFFIPFIILAAFTALNLIIAVIVDAMNTLHDMPSAKSAMETVSVNGVEGGEQSAEEPAERGSADAGPRRDNEVLYEEIRALRGEVADLSALLSDQRNKP